MKEKQAIEILRYILRGAQLVRSIVQETLGELPDLPKSTAEVLLELEGGMHIPNTSIATRKRGEP